MARKEKREIDCGHARVRCHAMRFQAAIRIGVRQ